MTNTIISKDLVAPLKIVLKKPIFSLLTCKQNMFPFQIINKRIWFLVTSIYVKMLIPFLKPLQSLQRNKWIQEEEARKGSAMPEGISMNTLIHQCMLKTTKHLGLRM